MSALRPNERKLELDLPEVSRTYELFERVNTLAIIGSLDETLEGMLDIFLEITGGQAGAILYSERGTDRLQPRALRGISSAPLAQSQPVWLDQPILVETFSRREAVLFTELNFDSPWLDGLQALAPQDTRKLLSVPLMFRERLAGVVLIFDFTQAPIRLLNILVTRLAAEIEKTGQLEASLDRTNRLNALIAVLGQMGATLDRQQILRMIINYAPVLLNAEASSLFLFDEESNELVLQHASNNQSINLEDVRVPAGKGIIGQVVQTGQTVIVQDVAKDQRHYVGVDQKSGFVTRSILAVPLTTRMVALGSERGSTGIRTIGGLEALNKNDGAFTEEDAQLFRTLANQAATVLQIADLYTNANQLLEDVLKALMAAVDAKDIYTMGHSTRVQEFSLAIADELGLLPNMYSQISIGSLLHDVGKIGIPDAILGKPGRLTTEEYERMKQHPEIGRNIMSKVQALRGELSAIAEHHEHLDGTGYPNQLLGKQITITGRIVAVADVFDAMTSDRPYRPALEANEVFHYLREVSGTHLDGDCVEALIRARHKGKIKIQKECERVFTEYNVATH